MRWCALVFVYFADVFVLSFPLAIFEIMLEGKNGWGGTLNPNGWGRRLSAGTIVADVCEKSYLTVYHIFMFAFVVPGVLLLELQVATYAGLVQQGSAIWFAPVHAHILTQAGEVRIIPFLFLTAVWFSVLGVEDALWFALNWYYPKSWQDLLSGKIWWHTRWISLGPLKLPRFYLTTQLLGAIFLAASLYGPGS